MTNPKQEADFRAAQKETTALLKALPMAERMQIMKGNNDHPDFKIFSNHDKSLTGVLHVDLAPEGFVPDSRNQSRGR
jgi:hypothetical protein